MMRRFPRAALPRDLNASFVCRGCRLQQYRLFSSSLPQQSPPPPPASGFAALSSRRLICVSGPDAAKYLQGVITASITSPEAQPRTSGFYAAFLNPLGRILHDVFIYPTTQASSPQRDLTPPGTSFLIEVDSNEAERLAKHIKRYKLRAKFEVRLLAADEVTVWHAWDETGKPVFHDLGALRALTKDPRAPGLGYRFLQSGNDRPPFDLEQSDELAYTIRRYLHGVAEGQDEMIREHALPQESNMDLMNGIDYHKGCYVGQELTIRTKHRGVVRKRILPCMIYDTERAPPVTLQYTVDGDTNQGPDGRTADMIPRETSIGRLEKKGRSAGKWLKGMGNVGLGLCRLEIMTDIILPGEAASAVYSPADEFVLQWGGEDAGEGGSVKVKAFVPDWLRDGLNAAAPSR